MVKTTARLQTDQSPHRSAAESDRPLRETKGSAILDNRPEAVAQRRLAEAIHNSPSMVAQRRQLRGLFGEAAQLKGGSEEEELLQAKVAPVQRQRPEDEKLLQGKFEARQRKGLEEEEPLQGKFEGIPSAQLKEEAPKQNDTGLPDNLKSGIEALSGLSMDNVNVHYNSSQPAQLNALAYTQGADIHVAPGQEKHLPHEAWHVVQQKQGRVKPTKQLKGKTNINDDVGLEKEADIMGARAIGHVKAPGALLNSPSKGKTVQLVLAASSFLDLLKEQKTLEGSVTAANGRVKELSEPSKKAPPEFDVNKLYVEISKKGLNIPGKEVLPALVGHFIQEKKAKTEAYAFPEAHWEEFLGWLKDKVGNKQVTAGFEFEFSSMAVGNPFEGVTHVELSKSSERIKDLPFTLETDADNALELVTPPMFLDAIDTDIPLPKPAEAEKVETLIKTRLQEITAEDKTMKAMAEAFKANPGLTFDLQDAKVTPKSLSDRSFGKFTKENNTVPGASIENIGVGKITKYRHGGIDTQINIATDAESYAAFVELNMANRDKNIYVKQFYDLQNLLEETIKVNKCGEPLKGFLKLFVRNIAGQLAIPSMNKISKKQQEAFERGKSERAEGDLEFSFYAQTSSRVKDIGNIWIKDNIINIGIGMLNKEDWNVVSRVIYQGSLQQAIKNFQLPEDFIDVVYDEDKIDKKHVEKVRKQVTKENRKAVGGYYAEARKCMLSAVETLDNTINFLKLSTTPADKMIGTPEIPFMQHNPDFIGPRQDTHLDPKKVQLPTWKQRLHVSELRSDPINSLAVWAEAAVKNKAFREKQRLYAEAFEKNAKPYERYNALLSVKEYRDATIRANLEYKESDALTVPEYESIKKRLGKMNEEQRFQALKTASDLVWNDKYLHVSKALANDKAFKAFD